MNSNSQSHQFTSTSLEIGQRIRAERLSRNLNQAEFASMLDISTSYLGALERGKRNLSWPMLEKISKKAGMSYDYLLHGTYSPSVSSHSVVAESTALPLRKYLKTQIEQCTEEELYSFYQVFCFFLSSHRSPLPPSASDKR